MSRLSESEAVLAPAPDLGLPRELAQDFLYFHIDVARRARMRMDAAHAWSSDYHNDHVEREAAIAQASKHYSALIAMGGVQDALLEQLARAEGVR